MWTIRLLSTSACASWPAHDNVSAAGALFRGVRRTPPALRGLCIAHLAAIALAAWLSTTPLLFADFFDSPTDYVPAISDVYVCNNGSGTVLILHGITGALLKTIYLPQGAKPLGIAFLPNYNGAYVTDNITSKIYFIWNRRLAKIISTSGLSGMIAEHPKGTFAYIVGTVGTLVLDTVPSSPTFNTIIATISGVGGPTAFTPDGTRAYVTIDGSYGSVSQLKAIDTGSHSVSATIQLPLSTAPSGPAITPDGTRVYVPGWVAHNVSVIDADPTSPTYNTVTQVISVAGEARGIALSPSGNLGYITLDTGGVDVIVTTPSSSQYNQVIAHILDAGPFGGIHNIAISLDGRFTYVNDGSSSSGGSSNLLYVVDSEPLSATFNKVVNTLTAGDAMGVAVAPHR